MKKFLLFKFLILLFGSSIIAIYSFITPPDKEFYYAYNEKVYLKKSDHKIVIRYKNNEVAQTNDINKTESRNLETRWQDKRTIVVNTRSAIEADSLINQIKKNSNVQLVRHIYALQGTGLEMIVTDEILIKSHIVRVCNADA